MKIFKIANIAGLILVSCVMSCLAQTSANGITQVSAPHNNASFLFVQVANSGSLTLNPDKKTYTITLNGVSNTTMKFADRPARISKTVTTEAFINNWNLGSNSFAKDHPNAVITYTENNNIKTLDAVELFNPQYIATKGQSQLVYQAIPVDKSKQLPTQLTITRPSVFIDTCIVGFCG